MGSETQFNPKDSQTTVRCSIDNLETEFEIRQYIINDDDDKNDKRYVVACKRLRGDPLAFKKIIDVFWQDDNVIRVMDVENNEDDKE